MGKHVGLALVMLFLLFFLPWLWGEAPAEREEELVIENVPEDTAPAGEEEAEPLGEKDGAVKLRVLVEGQVREMDLGTYLLGVVRAEMPASFELEALKAQAVAARTYTLYKMLSGGSANHPQADACDDITCCKAYQTRQTAAQQWGSRAEEYDEKLRRAVLETDGEYVLYEGQPILAAFHSSSAGATMDAVNVWSSALPYLTGVSTPESADTVPNYHSQAAFETEELRALLQRALPEAELTGEADRWFTNMQILPSGAVVSLDVGGVSVGGNELRTILGLRSPSFTMAFSGSTVTFSVTGYGHGVGMSQYGANVLAADGMTYREILGWYYTGTQVGNYPQT